MPKPIYLFFSLLYCTAASAQTIKVDNLLPRLTVGGDTVDAHDGRVIQFGDTFYWYGTAYGKTNGFTTSNHYVVYSSPDMSQWTYEGRLLPDQAEGVYYRPHVIYHAASDRYVLWYNWYPQLWDGQFGVATSDSPVGPFAVVNDNVQMARSEIGLGDFGLFVDDDATAYISYNTIQEHQVSIEKLSPDYLSSTLENGGVIARHSEAGSQFKRDGKYYLLTDYTCCFCNYGSGARVYISDDPLSGYTLTGNINRYPGRPAPVLTDGDVRGTAHETISARDSTPEHAVLLLPQTRTASSITLDIFTGNRPENCGDVSNPRVHPPIGEPDFSLEYWDYDRWRSVALTDSSRSNAALSQRLHLSFPEVKSNRWRITPRGTYPFASIYLNEITLAHPTDASVMVGARAFITGPGISRSPIIPAQQTYVMRLETDTGPEFIWMGDLWGSASDNVKGHDYQYWSAPLEFNKDGSIAPLSWTDSWEVSVR